MSNGMVVLTVAILVFLALIGVVAAFLDRRRGREIEQDPERSGRRPRRGPRD